MKMSANSAFSGCKGLANIDLPDSVTSIGDSAFYNCTGLTSIVIPVSVTDIGAIITSGCSNLTGITVAEGNAVYDSRDNCNAIIRTADNTLVYGCKSSTVPDGVASIGANAFRGCNGLGSVHLPDGLTSIGESAFSFCDFTDINIPDSVASIGSKAFEFATKLNSVTYKGTAYTSKSAIGSALSADGVTVGYEAFSRTAMSE